tara:strand:+ start:21343 stop:21633 length:291 start_codon:yes stop_codon:yes gene_type:complete
MNSSDRCDRHDYIGKKDKGWNRRAWPETFAPWLADASIAKHHVPLNFTGDTLESQLALIPEMAENIGAPDRIRTCRFYTRIAGINGRAEEKNPQPE